MKKTRWKVEKVETRDFLGKLTHIKYFIQADVVAEKRRLYEKEWKRQFRDRINEARRIRYAHDEEFREKEKLRVKKATKPWAELTEQEKERKRKWQRDYQRKRYQADPEFRSKQRNRARKSSTGFMRFGGYKAGNEKKKAK